MNTFYQNLYPFPPEMVGTLSPDIAVQLIKNGAIIGENTSFNGIPRVAFTRVVDNTLLLSGEVKNDISKDSFLGCFSIGDNCYVESGQLPAFHTQPCRFTCVQINDDSPGKIIIGSRTILQGVAIVAYNLVEISDDVIFGPMVTIMDSSGHALVGRGQAGEVENITSAPIYIEKGAWIGFGATILKGVTIGEGAVIGAQAVVSSSVPPYTIASGNPARIIKYLGL